MVKAFLLATAAGEGGTGLGLLLVPVAVLRLLLGVQAPPEDIVVIGRVTGAALLAIGIACAVASRDPGSPALLGVLAGVLVYDVAAVALLAQAGGLMGLAGPLLWPAAALHVALAVWGVMAWRGLPRSGG